MAKIRDTATVVLQNGVPKVRRGGVRNASRNSRVERKDVDARVMRYAMELTGNNISRIRVIDTVTVQILPER